MFALRLPTGAAVLRATTSSLAGPSNVSAYTVATASRPTFSHAVPQVNRRWNSTKSENASSYGQQARSLNGNKSNDEDIDPLSTSSTTQASDAAAAAERPAQSVDLLWKNILTSFDPTPDPQKYGQDAFSSLYSQRQRGGRSGELATEEEWIEEMESAWSKRLPTSYEQKPSRPLDGRMVDFDSQRQRSYAEAFPLMSAILARNNVRKEIRLGERYEKPNRLRRRLASERHRRRFANLVRQKVQLIMHLKSRGA